MAKNIVDESMECALTVQEAAERNGISVHTLRYYERAGLIDPVDRNISGHRRYGETDLARIRFLKKMRATGMPICRLQQYVTLVRMGPERLDERIAMLEAHRCHVRAQIAELTDCLALVEYKIENALCLEAEQEGKQK